MINDIGTERAVLSGLIKYGYKGYMEISDIINIKCFTSELNQMLYKCIEHVFLLDNKEVDVALLYSAASSLGYQSQIVDSTDAQKFIRSLYNFPIELKSIRPLCVKILTLSIARKAQDSHKMAYDKLSKISGDESLIDILSVSEEPYFNLLGDLTQEDEISSIGNMVEGHVQNLIDNPNQSIGVPSPFPIWNSVIGGGLRTGVHLVCARFKVGKSSIGKETAMHCAGKLNIPTLYIDTEMSTEEQTNRMLAGLSLVDIDTIENGQFSKDPVKNNRILEASAKLAKYPLYHKNVAGQDFISILNYMKRWIHKSVGFDGALPKPHLIVYDYFKMMDASSLKDMQEYQAMGFQIAALHDFCQKYQTPVLSFVQINRDGLTKDSTDVIAQSDRLGWNAISLSIYKRKSPEEIAEDGIENGNMKMIPLEGRFMRRLDDGDYINMQFQGEFSAIRELKTRNTLKKQKNDANG